MKHRVPHDLGQEQAKKVALAAWKEYADRFADYNPTSNWTTETDAKIGFTAKGITIKGELGVRSDCIELDFDVPFLLKPFKSKAISVIETKIKAWIEKSKRGEIA